MMERVEPWMLEEGAAPVPAGQKPPQELPSDEQFASMSRKERIAMMEREEQAKARKPSSSNSYDLASDEPEQSLQQRPASMRRREDRQPTSEAGSMSPCRPSPLSTPPHSEKPPPAATTPRRCPRPQREECRPQQSFPSDEEFSKMSRKERIALMERESSGYQGDGGRLAQSQPPRARPFAEVDDSAAAIGGLSTSSPISGAARHRARGSASSDPDRYDGPIEQSVGARRPQVQRSRPAPELSDEAFASMSRKERIALLERESGFSKKSELRTASPKLPPIEQPSPRLNPHARGPRRVPSQGPRGGAVHDGDDQSIGVDDDAAFEERRKQRRMRLQNRQRCDAPTKLQCSDDAIDPVDDLKVLFVTRI